MARSIEHKQSMGESVANGDKFLAKFNQKLEKNGLEIGDDGKLHPTADNLKKPLYTEKQLQQQFKQGQAARIRAAMINGRQ